MDAKSTELDLISFTFFVLLTPQDAVTANSSTPTDASKFPFSVSLSSGLFTPDPLSASYRPRDGFRRRGLGEGAEPLPRHRPLTQPPLLDSIVDRRVYRKSERQRQRHRERERERERESLRITDLLPLRFILGVRLLLKSGSLQRSVDISRNKNRVGGG